MNRRSLEQLPQVGPEIVDKQLELLNLETAKALGLTIPPSLRLRGDQIID